MTNGRSTLGRVLTASVLLALVGGAGARRLRAQSPSITYTFTKIADTTAGFDGLGNVSGVNDSGRVAFVGLLPTGVSGIFTGDGGPVTTIADTSGALFRFSFPSAPNSSGTVAFVGVLNTSVADIFVGSGGVLTARGVIPTFLSPPAINDVGSVAFLGQDQLGNNAVLRSDPGGSLKVIAFERLASGAVSGGASPNIDVHGNVVFVGSKCCPVVDGIFQGDGVTSTTVIDTSSGLSFLDKPVINGSGAVAFLAHPDPLTTEVGAYKVAGSVLSPVILPIPGSIIYWPALNDTGQVAFPVETFAPSGSFGIFTGPDLVADKVIKVGDPLFGSIVTEIDFGDTFRPGFNNNGQIAFTAGLLDGRFVIVRADPFHGNRVPVISTNGPILQEVEGQPFASFWVSASDPDGDPVTCSFGAPPPPASLGLSLDPQTCAISGIPPVGTAGDYTITVTASDGSLSASTSFTLRITVPLPAARSNLTAVVERFVTTSFGPLGLVDLTWQNPQPDTATDVDVYLSVGVGFVNWAHVPSTATTYQYQSADPGGPYCFYVVGRNASGDSARSNTACVTVPTLLQIGNVTVTTAATSAIITFTTDAPAGGAVSYGLASSGVLNSTVFAIPTDATFQHFSATIVLLQPLATYNFRISMVPFGPAGIPGNVGTSSGSFTTIAQTSSTFVISNVKARTTITSADITWSTNLPAASTVQYAIGQANQQGCAPTQAFTVVPGVANTRGNQFSASIGGLVPGTTYCYRIDASSSDPLLGVLNATAAGSFATTSGQPNWQFSIVGDPTIFVYHELSPPYAGMAIGRMTFRIANQAGPTAVTATNVRIIAATVVPNNSGTVILTAGDIDGVPLPWSFGTLEPGDSTGDLEITLIATETHQDLLTDLACDQHRAAHCYGHGNITLRLEYDYPGGGGTVSTSFDTGSSNVPLTID